MKMIRSRALIVYYYKYLDFVASRAGHGLAGRGFEPKTSMCASMINIKYDIGMAWIYWLAYPKGLLARKRTDLVLIQRDTETNAFGQVSAAILE